jgi:hypothetical protein
MPAMARIFAADFSYLAQQLEVGCGTLSSDHCGITDLPTLRRLVDSPRRFGLNNRRTMQRFSVQARLKRETHAQRHKMRKKRS